MDKERESISILQLGSKLSLHYYKQPLLLCNSGGKDSLVLLELAKRAGIPYEVQYSHTTADAPETVRYVRKQLRDLELGNIKTSVNMPMYKGQPTSIWKLIESKGLPTRLHRYCCAILKETNGGNRAIATGVRKSESVGRLQRTEFETRGNTKKDAYRINASLAAELFEDDVQRKPVEHDDKFIASCRVQGSTIVNPIIDWTSSDVWSFIRSEKLDYNPCYDMGFSRVGCIGCPMGGKARNREFAIWPKMQNGYRMALKRYLDKHPNQTAKGNVESWWNWWMENGVVDGQVSLFECGGNTDG